MTDSNQSRVNDGIDAAMNMVAESLGDYIEVFRDRPNCYGDSSQKMFPHCDAVRYSKRKVDDAIILLGLVEGTLMATLAAQREYHGTYLYLSQSSMEWRGVNPNWKVGGHYRFSSSSPRNAFPSPPQARSHHDNLGKSIDAAIGTRKAILCWLNDEDVTITSQRSTDFATSSGGDIVTYSARPIPHWDWVLNGSRVYFCDRIKKATK